MPEVLACSPHPLVQDTCYPKSLGALSVRRRRNTMILIIQVFTTEIPEPSDGIQTLSSAYFLAYQGCRHDKFSLIQEMPRVVPIYAPFYQGFFSKKTQTNTKPKTTTQNVKSWSLLHTIILSNRRRTGSADHVFAYCRAVGTCRTRQTIRFPTCNSHL